MYICICNAITEKRIQEAVSNGVATFEQLKSETGVATCCGCCAPVVQDYLPKQAGGCSGDCANCGCSSHSSVVA